MNEQQIADAFHDALCEVSHHDSREVYAASQGGTQPCRVKYDRIAAAILADGSVYLTPAEAARVAAIEEAARQLLTYSGSGDQAMTRPVAPRTECPVCSGPCGPSGHPWHRSGEEEGSMTPRTEWLTR